MAESAATESVRAHRIKAKTAEKNFNLASGQLSFGRTLGFIDKCAGIHTHDLHIGICPTLKSDVAVNAGECFLRRYFFYQIRFAVCEQGKNDVRRIITQAADLVGFGFFIKSGFISVGKIRIVFARIRRSRRNAKMRPFDQFFSLINQVLAIPPRSP